VADWLRQQVLAHSSTALLDYKELLLTFGNQPAITQLLGELLQHDASAITLRASVLDLLPQIKPKAVPSAWLKGIEQSLKSENPALAQHAVLALRSLPAKKLKSDADDWKRVEDSLIALSAQEDLPTGTRLEALLAMPEKFTASAAAFTLVRSGLATNQPALVRLSAAEALGKLNLSQEQLGALTGIISTASPLELPLLLTAFDNVTDEQLAAQLVATLKASPSLSRLRADALKSHLTKLPAGAQKAAEGLLAQIGEAPEKQRQRLEQLQASLHDGERNRGQRIFSSAKAGCYNCHQIGYVGGKVGPDLSKIGAIRTEHDLLESIVYPSASFVRSYEPMIIAGKDGEQYAGVLRNESADTYLLISGPGAEKRFSRDEIAEIRPGDVSVMPEGLEQQLSPQELADLMVYLKSLK
jgi:putative heme-binding domain-containing protein